MRITILIILCAIISSCGVFKNTSKNVDIVKSGVGIDVRNKSELDIIDNSHSTSVNTSVKRDVNFNGYKITANNIIINPDGSIKASGNVNLSGYNNSTKDSKDSVSVFNQSNIKYAKISDERVKIKQDDYNKQVTKESKASSKGIISIFVGLIILIIGILTYLKLTGK